MRFALGVCCEDAGEAEAAKQAYFRVAGFDLKNDLEERARYRLARLFVVSHGIAQARKQLEVIVQGYADRDPVVPRAYVYQPLSHVCAHLDDDMNAKRYSDLAKQA
jgi:hypothetical protein